MRHTLSSGNWIDVLPIQALKAKHRDRADGAVKLYVQFDDQGNPDLSKMPLSMSLQAIRRNALMAQIITAWSFTMIDYDDDGQVKPGTDDQPLPVPYWDGASQGIVYEDAYGEIGLDDFAEIEEILAPYLAKIQRRPDPKEMTTENSNGTSRARAGNSRKG